jgi:hypothetical protein
VTETVTFLLSLVGVGLLVVVYKFHRKRDEVRRRREAIQWLMEDADLERRGRSLKAWRDVRHRKGEGNACSTTGGR